MSPKHFSVETLFGVAVSLAIFGWDTVHCHWNVVGRTEAGSRYCPGNKIYFPPNGKCYSKGSAACPGERIYFPHFRKCYLERTPGLCKGDLVYRKLADDNSIGECQCTDKYEDSVRTRPVILVKKFSRCYPIYHQGPCRQGEWLVVGAGNAGVCERIPCPAQYYAQPSARSGHPPYGESRFVFAILGRCVTTGDRCSRNDPEQKQVYFSYKSLFPACIPISTTEGYTGALGPNVDNRCAGGLAPDVFGGCEPLSFF